MVAACRRVFLHNSLSLAIPEHSIQTAQAKINRFNESRSLWEAGLKKGDSGKNITAPKMKHTMVKD